MKKKLIAIWAVMISLGIIPVSCDLFCPCGCGPSSQSQEFSIKDLAIVDLVMGTSVFNPDMFYSKDQYFKVIDISDYEYLTENQESNLSFNLINSANACSPPPQPSIQRITDLKIINKKETTLYESVILEGQDISEKFLISDYPLTLGLTISSFLFQEQRFYMNESFYLRWNDSVAIETELNFDVLIKLSDGQEFRFEDEIMKIK